MIEWIYFLRGHWTRRASYYVMQTRAAGRSCTQRKQEPSKPESLTMSVVTMEFLGRGFYVAIVA